MLHGSLTVLIFTIFNIGYIHSYNASDECLLRIGKFITIEQFLEKWNSQGDEPNLTREGPFENKSFMSLLDTKIYDRYLTELQNYYFQNGYEKSMELYANASAISEIRPLDIDALLTLARNIKPDVTLCDLLTLLKDSYFYMFDLRNEECELPNGKFVTMDQFLMKWNSEGVGSVLSLLNWTKVYERHQTELLDYYLKNDFDTSMELYTKAAIIAETHPLDADALLRVVRKIKPDVRPCHLLTLINDSYFSSSSVQNEICELPNGKCVKVNRLLKEWNAQTFARSVMLLVNWTEVDDQYQTEIMNYYNQSGFEKSMELFLNANTIAGKRPLDADALLTLARNVKPDITKCNLLTLINQAYFYIFNLEYDCEHNYEEESG